MTVYSSNVVQNKQKHCEITFDESEKTSYQIIVIDLESDYCNRLGAHSEQVFAGTTAHCAFNDN